MEQALNRDIFLYDTTLRDGSQRRGISFTVGDKLKITRLLDQFGMAYIEGGWPGSNPKDSEYFSLARGIPLRSAKLVAFGSTRRSNCSVRDDQNIQALLAAATPTVAIVGKSWTLHVKEVLETTLDENLKMISDSIKLMKDEGKEVIYDAEHLFDGFRDDPEYALKTVEAADKAGADWIVLCDTNGGSLPGWIREVVSRVLTLGVKKVGIHTHNDSELAVANSLAAVEAGCTQIQGTVNGYGERCGNANLISIIPTLEIKMGLNVVPNGALSKLTDLSRAISEIANLNHDTQAPYVGTSSFAHKGGIHVAAVEKVTRSYEHIDPLLVGNVREVLVSELSGRGNVRVRATELGLGVDGQEKKVLSKIKELEGKGYHFENAEASFELLVRRHTDGYEAPFEVEDILVVSEQRSGHPMKAQAIAKLKVKGEIMHTAAEGDGPVHALDGAMRKALVPAYEGLNKMRLSDYKVRILDPDLATQATTRVLIEAASDNARWSTVGCAPNIIDASFRALSDSFEYFILKHS